MTYIDAEEVEYELVDAETGGGKILYWVNVATGVAALAYYLWLMKPEGDVVPFKNKLYHYGSQACETVAAAAWDGALALRRTYRREVDS